MGARRKPQGRGKLSIADSRYVMENRATTALTRGGYNPLAPSQKVRSTMQALEILSLIPFAGVAFMLIVRGRREW